MTSSRRAAPAAQRDPVHFLQSSAAPVRRTLASKAHTVDCAAVLIGEMKRIDARADDELRALRASHESAVRDAAADARRAYETLSEVNDDYAAMLAEALDLRRAIAQSTSSVASAALQRRLDALRVQIAAQEARTSAARQSADESMSQITRRAGALLVDEQRMRIADERDSAQHELLVSADKYRRAMQTHHQQYAERLARFVRESDEMRRTLRPRALPTDAPDE